MIYGIGTDIVAVSRMETLHARFGGRLAERILTALERDEFDRAGDKSRFLAKRFAAKEAMSKALGSGMRTPVSFRAIAVVHDDLGKPGFRTSPELAAWMRTRDIGQTHLSLSDEQDYVVAFVIAEHA
jgi:holo-[acyl-carrier protein] synthase